MQLKHFVTVTVLFVIATPAMATDAICTSPPTFKLRVDVDRGRTEYTYMQARDAYTAKRIGEAQFGKGKVKDYPVKVPCRKVTK